MVQNYRDAMVIYRWAGCSNVFVTFTCNPQWLEIKRELLLWQQPQDWPNLVTRMFKIKLKEFDQWHSQEPYFGTHDCGNLCRWISKAWVAACTHSHLFYWRLQATHGRGCKPHDQCWTSEFRNKQVGPRDSCQMHDAWSMWSYVSKCPMHGRKQMQKTISTQVPIRDWRTPNSSRDSNVSPSIKQQNKEELEHAP